MCAFGQNSRIEKISIGDTVHSISYEQLNRDPPLFIVDDSFSTQDNDVSTVTLSASLTESCRLKALTLTVVGKGEFALSGELEWRFPFNHSLDMVGKLRTKNLPNGSCEMSVTFLSGLDDLCKYSTLLEENHTAKIIIYSRRGTSKEFQIPYGFFHRILPEKAAG